MPGGVRNVPSLWEFLREQKDVHMEFAEPRFSAKGFYHPNTDRPGTAVASHGLILDKDPLLFNPAFFGITDTEVEILDAAQRKLLECTYKTFEMQKIHVRMSQAPELVCLLATSVSTTT